MQEQIIRESSTLAEDLTVIRKVKNETSKRRHKIKVAAYCRVSTAMEKQESSFELQISTYKEIIQSHPDWELVKVYADQGITGTMADKRPEFQRMIDDALKGKIDLIMAKSLSRFSRNTVDCLSYIRLLQSKGVGVYFEKERMNTQSIASEMMLTVFAAFAQEESHSNSENMKKGIRSRFKMGEPKYTKMLGYRHDCKTGDWSIVEDEADIVRRIFKEYLNGKSTQEIAKSLNHEGIPGPGNARTRDGVWYQRTVDGILHCEKYIGDCLMQKFYVKDHLTHQNCRNNTFAVEKYYKEGHHQAIISKEDFDEAQLTAKLKENHRGIHQYPFYGFLKCPYCGENLINIQYKGLSKKEELPNIGWTCGGTGENKILAERTACPHFNIRHKNLLTAIASAFAEKGIIEPVSYHAMKKYVNKVTFPSWISLQIEWLDGNKTTAHLPFDSIREHPFPTFKKQGGAFYLDDLKTTSTKKKMVERKVKDEVTFLKKVTVDFDKFGPLVKAQTKGGIRK